MEFKEGKNINDEVDYLFKDKPNELKKIRDNQQFINEIQEKPLSEDLSMVPVFGTSVSFNNILKKNIWDRSIYTVDMLCDTFVSMTYEQLKKYMAKKRTMPLNILWLLLILMGVGVGVIILVLFLSNGGLGGII